ncbi:hypothetical protein C8J56DRAFT_965071 [Mycena floridula]|nr:hypothetical protein C8J56DRAFT_965071 [Mycena floridula]
MASSKNPAPTDPLLLDAWAEKLRAELLEGLDEDNQIDTTKLFECCKAWYDRARCFIPPLALRSRHDGFEEVWSSLKASKRPTKAQMDKVTKHIHAKWKPNASLFDGALRNLMTGGGYPDVNLNVYQAVEYEDMYNYRLGLHEDHPMDHDCPAFSTTEIFFDAVVEALAAFKDGKVMVEFVLGELSTELRKMGSLTKSPTRPDDFPRSFTRTWLSNVPDYSNGPLNTAIYAIPRLQRYPDASAAANVLRNMSMWKTPDHFCHNYTLLKSADLPRFLGCRALDMKPIWGLIRLGPLPLPRPLSTLASKSELTTWLVRLLFTIIVPPETRQSPYRVEAPNNLVVFFDLLLLLREIGFPAHWISEFLASLLNDSLTTDVAPYLGMLPIPVNELTVRPRKINLAPWQAEFETIVALSYDAWPFPILLPTHYLAKSHQDIAAFQVFGLDEFPFIAEGLPISDMAWSLMFCKSTEHPDSILKNLADILQGSSAGQKLKGKMYVLTVLKSMNMHSVEWQMSRERVRMMKQEGWSVTIYRLDGLRGCQTIPADRWVEVQ